MSLELALNGQKPADKSVVGVTLQGNNTKNSGQPAPKNFGTTLHGQSQNVGIEVGGLEAQLMKQANMGTVNSGFYPGKSTIKGDSGGKVPMENMQSVETNHPGVWPVIGEEPGTNNPLSMNLESETFAQGEGIPWSSVTDPQFGSIPSQKLTPWGEGE